MYLSKLRESKFEVKDESKIFRYVIPVASSPNKSKITVEPMSPCHEVGCEHPAINQAFRGKPYRFAYVTGYAF